jgi:TonB-linked SusC/RagA family outer membrane protein
MKKNLQLTSLYLLLCCFLSFSNIQASFASDNHFLSIKKQETPIIELLEAISKKFQVFFTYDIDLLKDIKVNYDLSKAVSLNKAINAIMEKTDLRYEHLGNKYYVIYKNTRIGKRNAKKIKRKLRQISKLEKSGSLSLRKMKPQQKPIGQLEEIIKTAKQLNQEKPIKGRVTDANGVALIGVNILVKGTSIGTVTDIEGYFYLNIPNEANTLVFSYVGYLSKEVAIEGLSNFNVQLAEDVANLEEVVIIGYGVRKKRDITSSVSHIESAEIAKSVTLSPEYALQGKTPGIQVQLASGDPNDRPTIRIRGVNTLGFNDPLIVIDGVPVAEFGAGAVFGTSGAAASDLRGSQNILNLINPDDIASMSVLKDAAATAVYGLRASNGVILIETKRGKGANQKARITLSAERGIKNIRNQYDFLSTPEYVTLLTEQYNNAAEPFPEWLDPGNPAYLGNSTTTVDWQDEMINKNAIIEDYSLSVSGGNNGSNYYFSAAYANQESSLKFNSTKRYSFALNADFKINDWLKIGETFRIALTQGDDSRGKNGNPANLDRMFLTPPWQPIYDQNNRFGFAEVKDEEGNILYGNETGFNHFAIPSLEYLNYNLLRTLGNAYIQITPDFLPGLLLKGSLGVDYLYNSRQDLQSKNTIPFYSTGGLANSVFNERHLRNFNIIGEFMVAYNRTFSKKHHLSLLFNSSKQEYKYNGTQAVARGIRFEDKDVITLTPAALGATSESSSVREARKLMGILVKFGYNYDSKYYLDASWRRDGSSVFAPRNRFGNFYGISGAWRISREDFLKESSFINDLKLRASWGQAGNQETRPFGYSANINLNPRYPIGGDATLAIGSFPSNYPVEDLTWEKTTSYNYGLDAAFLDYKLTLTLEYYDKLTDGILRPFTLPFTAGINQNPVINLAEVSNKGLELQLGWNDKIGDLSYTISANLTTVNNKVKKLFLTDENNDRILVTGNTAIQIGQPINFYYGWQTNGIFQSDAEATAWADQFSDKVAGGTKAAGDFAYADLFGAPNGDTGAFKSPTPDGQIDNNDQTYLGSSIPGYYYGINVGLEYKGFDASFFFQGVGDIQKINQVRISGERMSSQGLNQLSSVLNRWTPSNPSTTMPRALVNDQVGNSRFSNRWVEDADYLRFANFQLGYTFSNNILKNLQFENLRVYLSGTNLGIMTSYSGLDPEVNFSNDPDVNPPPVVWLFGLNATF